MDNEDIQKNPDLPDPINDYDNDLTPTDMTPYVPGHIEDPSEGDFFQYVVDFGEMIYTSVDYAFRFVALSLEKMIYALGTILDEIHEPLSFLPSSMILMIDLSLVTIIVLKVLKR